MKIFYPFTPRAGFPSTVSGIKDPVSHSSSYILTMCADAPLVGRDFVIYLVIESGLENLIWRKKRIISHW